MKSTKNVPTTPRSGSRRRATVARPTETSIGSRTAVATKTTKATMNLAEMTLVGETGLVRVQPSVPRSRSVDSSAIVARIAISATV